MGRENGADPNGNATSERKRKEGMNDKLFSHKNVKLSKRSKISSLIMRHMQRMEREWVQEGRMGVGKTGDGGYGPSEKEGKSGRMLLMMRID